MESIILAIIIVVIGSALFSSIEAALFSVSISRAKILFAKKTKGAEALVKVREKIQRPITVIVIANDMFMIVGSMIVGVMAAGIFESFAIGVISATMTTLIIIFGEIVPKAFGESNAERISLIVAGPLLTVTNILRPILVLFEYLTKPFIKKRSIVSEEEIRILSRIGELEGTIEKDEQEMIQRVFLLNDLTASDIMTPRTVMEALEADDLLGDLGSRIEEVSHTRLPVYEDNLDKIIGVCHQRDLLKALLNPNNHNKPVRIFMQEPVFVPHKMRSDELLPFFQKKRQHLAVVTDEFGGTAGVVSLEDVIEQLVGEIVDENDRVEDMRVRARKLIHKKLAKKEGVQPEEVLD